MSASSLVDAVHSDPANAVVRWLAMCASALLVGASCFSSLVTTHAPSLFRRERALRAVRVAAAVLAIAAMLRMLQESSGLAAAPSGWWEMVKIILTLPWGYAWGAQVIGASWLLARPQDLVVQTDRSAVRARAAVLLVATSGAPAFQGHAAGSPSLSYVAVVADAIHTLAAGAWIGTLALLALLAFRQATPRDAARVVSAFTPLALSSAFALGVTGVFASWLHVQTFDALRRSEYGQRLVVKVVLVIGVASLGALNWKRFAPRLRAGGGFASFRVSVRAELALAVLVLAATAVLIGSPLPSE